MWVSRLRTWGSRFKVSGVLALGVRLIGFDREFQGLRFWGSGFGVRGSGACGLNRGSGSRSWVQGLGFGA